MKLRIHNQKVHRSTWKDCGDKSKSKGHLKFHNIRVNKNLCTGCDNKLKIMRYFRTLIENSHWEHRELTKTRFGGATCGGYWFNSTH